MPRSRNNPKRRKDFEQGVEDSSKNRERARAMSNPYSGWSSFPSAPLSHSASGPVLQSEGPTRTPLVPPIFPPSSQQQVAPSRAQQKAGNELIDATRVGGRPDIRGSSLGNQRFVCEVCHMTNATDDESFSRHLESKNHRHMKVLFQNGIWPATADGKSDTLKGAKQFNPRVYRMAGLGKKICCLACQVTCMDATELLQHQMLPSHLEKLHRLSLNRTAFPLIYYCHICDFVMGTQHQNGRVLYDNHLISETHKAAIMAMGQRGSGEKSAVPAQLAGGNQPAASAVSGLKDKASAWMTDEILMMHQKMKKTVERYKEALREQKSRGQVNPDVAELKILAESYKAKVESLVRDAQYQYIRRKCAEAGTLPPSEAQSTAQKFESEKLVQLHPDQIQLVKSLQPMEPSGIQRENLQGSPGSSVAGNPKANDIAKLTAFLKSPGGAESLKLLLGKTDGQAQGAMGEGTLSSTVSSFQPTLQPTEPQPSVQQPGAKAVAALAAAGLLDSDIVLEFLLKNLSNSSESGMSEVQKKMRVYLLEQLVEKRKQYKSNQQTVTDLMLRLSGKTAPPAPSAAGTQDFSTVASSRSSFIQPSRSDMPKEHWESMVNLFLKKTEEKKKEELASTLYDGPRIEYVWDGDDPTEKEYVEDRQHYFTELEKEEREKELDMEKAVNRQKSQDSNVVPKKSRQERSRSRDRHSQSRSRQREPRERSYEKRSKSRSRSRSRSRHRDSRWQKPDRREGDRSLKTRERDSRGLIERPTRFEQSGSKMNKGNDDLEFSTDFHDLEAQWEQFESAVKSGDQQRFGNREEREFLNQITRDEQFSMPDTWDDLERKKLEMHMQNSALRREASRQTRQVEQLSARREEEFDMMAAGFNEIFSTDKSGLSENWEALLDDLLMESRLHGVPEVVEDEMEIVDPIDDWVEKPPEFIKEYDDHPEQKWDTDDLLAASQELAKKTETKLSRRQRWDVNEGRIDQMRKGATLPTPRQRIIAPFEIGKMPSKKLATQQLPVPVPAASLASALPPPVSRVSPGLMDSLRGAIANVQGSFSSNTGMAPQQPVLLPRFPQPQQQMSGLNPNLLASAIQQLTGLKAEISVGNSMGPTRPVQQIGGIEAPKPWLTSQNIRPPFALPPPITVPPPVRAKMNSNAPFMKHLVAILLPNSVKAIGHKFSVVTATLEGSIGCGIPDGMTLFFKPAEEVKSKLDISPCCITVHEVKGGLMQFSVPVFLNHNVEFAEEDKRGLRIGTVWPCKPVNLSEIRMNRPLPTPNADRNLLQRIGAVEQSLTANEWAELFDWINSVPDIFTAPGFLYHNPEEPDVNALAWGCYNHPTVLHLSSAEKLHKVLFSLCNASSGSENHWSKGTIHVHVAGDLRGIIKSGIDYRNLSEAEEKPKGDRMGNLGLFEFFMDKLLAASYFSLIHIAVGEVDARICQMTDPAYCALGNRILICSSHFDYHMGHLRNLFYLLRDWGLKVAPEECFFAKRSVEFLGHVFFENSVAPDQEFLNLIDSLPYPERQEDAVLVTSALVHFKHFLKDFTDSSRPLKDYKGKQTNKFIKFRWTVEMQRSVDRIRRDLRQAQPLIMPDLKEPLIIETTVHSEFGGANILQKGSDGFTRPIERMGRLFNKNEAKDKNDQEISFLTWILGKPRVSRMLKLARQPCIIYTRQSSVDWLLKNDLKSSKFENAKRIISNLNTNFRDRTTFSQDYPSLVQSSPDIEIIESPKKGQSLREKARPVLSRHDERAHRSKERSRDSGRRDELKRSSKNADESSKSSRRESDKFGRVMKEAEAEKRAEQEKPSRILPPTQAEVTTLWKPGRISSGRFDAPAPTLDSGTVDSRLTRINPPIMPPMSGWN